MSFAKDSYLDGEISGVTSHVSMAKKKKKEKVSEQGENESAKKEKGNEHNVTCEFDTNESGENKHYCISNMHFIEHHLH